MDQASQLFVRPDLRCPGAIALPRVVIHFAVAPRKTLTWRAPNDAELRAHDATLWVTRLASIDDYWMRPGDVLRIPRGERIWLSADGNLPAEVSITTAYVKRGEWPQRALAQMRRMLRGPWRSRE
ncbi:hypothetical protein WL05_24435 [Burkholderia ubonensis]|uniref:DUF2917 domain-containing protein n=1 Tax=Burkholderia ubonensis TaxID=101571 RepID=UPI00075C7674|nr:DUF2917 domain-containing protein [Burkholderia ubonensis]KVO06232.1 hypothetical protein WJ71_11685 [Burkholderia ubonensis]KVO88592.1 hypothetical protein WJ80_06365 [Burkholderia ubonensis]KVR20062.1 hypothetical protein WK14_24260 [Burkholderia ubonensis]KVX43564.1 hypothetical protein WL05_24435 [Burkholderia ubonensis]KWD20178.1 hypothetical protein WL62_19405 [Burkholderia ubonensis]